MTGSTDILDRAKAQLALSKRDMADAGETEINPGLVPDLVAEIERLRAENGRLRSTFRVNALRFVPGATHAEIDRILDGVSSQ